MCTLTGCGGLFLSFEGRLVNIFCLIPHCHCAFDDVALAFAV